MADDRQLLAHALAYARALPGTLLPVVPSGKLPAISEWPDKASTDAVQLRDWFGDDAGNMGWQPAADVIVLDIDTKGGTEGRTGFDTLADLEDRHGKLPATLTAETPTGGQHRVFKLPAGNGPAKNVVGSKIGLARTFHQ